jgi:hypothetical protein
VRADAVNYLPELIAEAAALKVDKKDQTGAGRKTNGQGILRSRSGTIVRRLGLNNPIEDDVFGLRNLALDPGSNRMKQSS